SGWKIKERSEKMAEAVRRISLERNKAWVGWEGEVLIDERGKGNSWIGRNFAYKPIVVKSADNMLGRRISLHVKNAFSTYLEAEKI
ncbi:MAG TPA: TRAM domain-containing protein, partial [archaeon]|nr:TRAM domain-containing protein [archaeon]